MVVDEAFYFHIQNIHSNITHTTSSMTCPQSGIPVCKFKSNLSILF